MKEVAITTTDNPFSPFTQFDDWFAFDVQKGYNTCSLLARVCYTSDSLSEEDQSLAIDEAIDEIIQFDVFGIYKKVFSEVSEPQ